MLNRRRNGPDGCSWPAYAGVVLLYVSRPWRFLFPAFGMAAAAAAFAMEKLGRDTMVRIAVRLSVGLVMAASLASLALNDLVDVGDPSRMPPQMSFAQYALGQFTRDEFAANVGKGVLELIIWMNENSARPVPKFSTLERLARIYATQSVVYSAGVPDRQPLAAMSLAAATPEDLVKALRAQGITHVYMNYSELNRLQHGYDYMKDANWNLIQDLVECRNNLRRSFISPWGGESYTSWKSR